MSPRSEKNKAPKLEDFCSITSSKRIYAADYVEDGIPFVRGKEVVQRFFGSGPLESELFISPTKFETLRDRFGAPTAGDLLLTSVGTLGVPYLVTDGDEFYFKDGNLIWFRSFDGLNSKFFYYWIRSRAGRAQLAKCTIGTSQAAYTIERLKEVEAPKHSIAQQERIADILSAYDDLIENNRRRIALLEEAARLLYREWFVHFRFPAHEHVKITDGLPEGWERRTLGSVLNLQRGFDLPVNRRIVGGVPVYGSTGIVGEHNVAKVDFPTLVTGRSGSLGKVCFVDDPCWPLNTSLWVTEFREVSIHFAYFMLSEMDLAKFNAGASVPTLDRKVAHGVNILVPSRNVANLFDEQMGVVFRQKKLLNQQIQKLDQVRDLLLPRLMNGAITV